MRVVDHAADDLRAVAERPCLQAARSTSRADSSASFDCKYSRSWLESLSIGTATELVIGPLQDDAPLVKGNQVGFERVAARGIGPQSGFGSDRKTDGDEPNRADQLPGFHATLSHRV